MSKNGALHKSLVVLRRVALVLMPWALMLMVFFGTFRQPPTTDQSRLKTATRHLLGLRHAIRSCDAVSRMQAVFPEGACFTITLYGLSWTNLLAHYKPSSELRKTAIQEVEWAIGQYLSPLVARPFLDTQVRNGVFWLGQRNLVLGQYLEVLPEESRPSHLEREFHDNSDSLYRAFMTSPTAHLDSYPGFCWPADNVTALASLVLHDRLYDTSYRTAFELWKAWTSQNCDDATGLPAGHVDSVTGELLQPSRGCANSWILALLPGIDRQYSSLLYQRYLDSFLAYSLGFRMFREYAKGVKLPSDVDS